MDWISEYIKTLLLKEYDPETIKHYELILREFESYCRKANTTHLALTRETARAYAIQLHGRELAAATINFHHSVLRVFYNYLIFLEKVLANHFVDIKSLKVGTPVRSTVPIRELEKLFELIDKNSAISMRDIAMFECFYGSGVTKKELQKLRIVDVDFELEQLNAIDYVKETQRYIPLPASTVFILRRYMAGRKLRWPVSRVLFPSQTGKHLSESSIYYIVKTFLILTSSKQNGPNTLRNSYAKHLLNAGAELQEVQLLLGHRTARATAKNDDLYMARLKENYDRAHPKA